MRLLTKHCLPGKESVPVRYLCVFLFMLGAALTSYSFKQQFAFQALSSSVVNTDSHDIYQIIFYYSWLPRIVLAIICGAALSLAGLLMQQVLRNPLVSPATLGVATGSQLALFLTTLFAPEWLSIGSDWIAMLGGSCAVLMVFMLSWKRGLAPLIVVLAGLVVNLYFSSINSALLLFYQEELKGLMVWGAGSLDQNSWTGVSYLLPRLGLVLAITVLLLRPLSVLDLDERSAKSLGAALHHLRFIGLALAIFLTGCVVSVAGVISFVGLVAPALAKLLGARTLKQRMIWSPLLGALLLLCTDLFVQLISDQLPSLVPTGATTALLGAPLLLWLIPRLEMGRQFPADKPAALPISRAGRPLALLSALFLLLLVLSVLALVAGQGATGWEWPSASLINTAYEWRLPRILAAISAGVLLALAGSIIQRLTGNPMASPELLGISSGSAMGLIATLWLFPMASLFMLCVAGICSALLVLALIVMLNQGNGFRSDRLLLTGMAVTALFEPVSSILLANNDPRGQQMLAWISGSTYYMDYTLAIVAGSLAMMMLFVSRLFIRWLEIFPLGDVTALSLGVGTRRARLILLVFVALLTVVSTLIVGPLSFVGLLAPHMARMLGFARASHQMLAASLLGGGLMVLADWVGRQILFPQEIPAGLVASLIGGTYFMWMLRKA